MRKLLLLALILTSCQLRPYWQQNQTNPQPTQQSTQENPTFYIPSVAWQTYTVSGTVTIRKEKNLSSPAVGWLLEGATVQAHCDGEWCEVVGGYVVSACLGEGEGKCTSK